MNYTWFLIILFITLLVVCQLIFGNESEHMAEEIIKPEEKKDNVNVVVNLGRNSGHYTYPYYNYPYLDYSYGWPYSWRTPFIWNNPTRYPKWYYPYYPYLYDYYYQY